MKSSTLRWVIFFVAIGSVLLITSEFLGSSVQRSDLPNASFVDPLPLWTEASAFQAPGEMRPIFWWTILVVLLIDVGCVVGYLRYQRQIKGRRLYWWLAATEPQQLLTMFAALQATERSTIQYEMHKQPESGGFYLALKQKKAPALYGPVLFSSTR